MKYLSIIFACIAVAAAAARPQQDAYSAEQAYQQLQNQPYIAFPNNDYSNTAGYYVPVPYDLYAALTSYSPENAQQFFNQLQQYGYYPIFNYSGNLAGFYTQAPGSNQPSSNDASYYVRNFARYGLYPVSNQQNQVVALYYASPNNAQYSYNTQYYSPISSNSEYNYFAYYRSYAPQYYPASYQQYNYLGQQAYPQA